MSPVLLQAIIDDGHIAKTSIDFVALPAMKIYGITNCDTVKKALTWLKDNNVPYEFHDFKKLGITTGKLQEWDSKVGYDTFLNKKGLTWKQLDPAVKDSVKISEDALKLLQEKTSMIKRPVIENDGFLFFGFDAGIYEQNLLNGK